MRNVPISNLCERVLCHLRCLGVRRFLRRAASLTFLTLSISGIWHAVLQPAPLENGEAREFVSAMTESEVTPAPLPAAFEARLGYRPHLIAGDLVDPHGGCSTPGGIGPETFDVACRTHDLAYDVLRFAEGEGDRLGAWARIEIDKRFYSDLLDECQDIGCQVTAAAFYTAVSANSLRQGFKAPTEEPTLPWLGLAFLVLGVAVGAPAPARDSGLLRRISKTRAPAQYGLDS